MNPRGRVLIVEDQPHVAQALAIALELEGVTSLRVAAPAEALSRLDDDGDIDVVIQDMNFSPGATDGAEGVVLFQELRRLRPDLSVILVTAWGNLEVAVRLMKEGAADYLEKPWNDQRLVATVRTQLRLAELERERRRSLERERRARTDLAGRADLCGLVYASAEMHEVVSLAVRVARADVPVLLTGANGTGKERIADVIQANSGRRERPWVKVNAAALPVELVEAELFGAEAGAYTGAHRSRAGRFEAADGGTLLLDEIAELPPAGQSKLLRVLQSGELERLGSSRPRRVDVRVIAATNVDLQAAITAGRFREDLYFRLNVIEIDVPALADRPADVTPLAHHFLARHAAESGRPGLAFGPDALAALGRHPWPGNVRELENRIRRACLVATTDSLEPHDLGLAAGPAPSPPHGRAATPEGEDDERHGIEAALTRAGGKVSRAAEELGLSRQALYRRMGRLGIVIERRPRTDRPDE